MGMKRLAWAGSLMAALLTTVSGQQARKPDFDTATLAWDRGDFVAALSAYRALITAPGGEQWLEPVALQTGELFQTREIAADGANPRFSPDGLFVAYETGSGAALFTRIVEPAAGMRVIAEVKGHSLAFLPQGDRVVYLKFQASEDLTRAQADLEKAAQTPAVKKTSGIVTRSLATGQERVCPTDGLLKSAVVPSADGRIVYVTGAREDDPSRSDIYAIAVDCDHPVAVTKEPGYKTGIVVDPKGAYLLYGPTGVNPFAKPAPSAAGAGSAGGGRGGGRGAVGQSGAFAVVDLKTGLTTTVSGTSPAFSADGSTLAYLSRSADETSVMAGPPGAPAAAVKKTRERVGAIAVSPDGSRLAFQAMPKDDWEIFVVNLDGSNQIRVTREIQHDVSPRFVTNTLLMLRRARGATCDRRSTT